MSKFDNPGDEQPAEPTWRDAFGCLGFAIVLAVAVAAICCYGPVLLFRIT